MGLFFNKSFYVRIRVIKYIGYKCVFLRTAKSEPRLNAYVFRRWLFIFTGHKKTSKQKATGPSDIIQLLIFSPDLKGHRFL